MIGVSASIDELVPADALAAYLRRAGFGNGDGPAAADLTIEPLGDGHSNVVVGVSWDGARVVLRRPPRPPFPKGAHDVLREARLLSALASTAARVPRVLGSGDHEAIGAPFYLSEWVDGAVINHAVPAELAGPGERRRIAFELVDALTEIHAADWRAVGLEGFGRPQGYLERQVRRFRGLAEEYRTREFPALERLGSWLEARLPEGGDAVVVHGDYRLGNVMFESAAPARIAVVLDWELATLGDPLADVGFMCAMWASPGDPDGLIKLSGVTGEPEFPSWEELANRYEARSGRSVARLNWYRVLALWKFCVIMEGNYRRVLVGASEDEFARELGADLPDIAEHAERWAAE